MTILTALKVCLKYAGPAATASMVVSALLAGQAGAQAEPARKLANPHDYAKKELCSNCHTSDPPFLNFDPITTCVKCHPAYVANHPVTRHPIGKPTRMNVPVNLPLGEDRQMNCSTCHDPHNRSGNRKLLRVEYKKLCIACHAGY